MGHQSLESVLGAAQKVIDQLYDPSLLEGGRHTELGEGASPSAGPGLPLAAAVLDMQTRAAALLGEPRINAIGEHRDPRAAVTEYLMAAPTLSTTDSARVREAALRTSTAGRIFLARQRGYELLKCPECKMTSVIPAVDAAGVFECQNDECDPGRPLRRFTRPTALGGNPHARVTLAEVADFTHVPRKTWEQRLRRARPRILPVGARGAESLYLWCNFEGWLDKRFGSGGDLVPL